jgi:phage shock protein PspC (stress-responsive transcriptional regulator)
METTTDTPAPRRLYRTRDDRYLGGVCSGLGRYFDLSPAIYRIAFVALAFAGGTGILVYVAAWAVIPEEGAEDSWASDFLRRHRHQPVRLAVLGVIAFAVLLALSESHIWPAPGNLALALVLAVAGVVWWQVSDTGRDAAADVPDGVPAHRHRRRPLVVASIVALLALAVLALVLAVTIPFSGGFGQRTEQPSVPADIQQKYELAIGRLTIDLRRVRLPVGVTRTKATLGIGDLIVRVPRNATVKVDGHVQAGELSLLGHNDSGTRVHDDVIDRVGSGRVLVLDARVGLGKVLVERGK